MRWFRRDDPPDHDESRAESDKYASGADARRAAERALEETRRRSDEVNKISESLKASHEKNHFTEQITLIFTRRGAA